MTHPLFAVLPASIDDPAAPSGGNRYDREVLRHLTATPHDQTLAAVRPKPTPPSPHHPGSHPHPGPPSSLPAASHPDPSPPSFLPSASHPRSTPAPHHPGSHPRSTPAPHHPGSHPRSTPAPHHPGSHPRSTRASAPQDRSPYEVREALIAGSWPRPEPAARQALADTLRAIPDGAVVLLDGLIACGVPELLEPHATRLKLAVLVHLPLSDETGLPASEAAELRALECRTLRLAATVIATSTPAARRVEELHGLSGVHAVPPGVDPAPQAVPSATGHRLLNVASLTHRKGQDLLLDALLMLPAELPWTCTVAGAGRLPNSTATPPATLRRTTSSPAPATSAHTTSSSAPGTSAHTTSGTAPATSTHATSSSAPGTSTDPTSSTAPATSAHTTSSTAPATSTHTTSSTAPATSAHTTSSTASGASAHTTSSTASPAPTRTASTAGAARTAAADATAVSPDDIARSWTIDHRPQGRTVQDPLEERGSVRFVGALSGAALDDAYANADLFVLPSRAETYGMVVTEALARGLPVVAADVGGVPEALGAAPGGGIPGRLIPPDDPHALAAALRDWLTDAGLRERWRRHALARRAELTGWDETARLLREVLEGLAA